MQTSGFSLLELMITLTIIFIVSLAAYTPYHHYQKKTQIKLAVKQIEQFISQTRNDALHGSASWSNLSFWLYLEGWENTRVTQLSYPYSATGSMIDRQWLSQGYQLALENNIYIENIGWHPNSLLFFEAITGKLELSYWDETDTKIPYQDDKLDIEISYLGSAVWDLRKSFRYYTATNVIDY